MIFSPWKTLQCVLCLRLVQATSNSDIASPTCIYQAEILSPGELHNLTIPCRKPLLAVFEFSDGSDLPVEIPPSNCTRWSEKSDLSLILKTSTPQGCLNLTITCQFAPNLCFSYTVEAPSSNPKYDQNLNSISNICDTSSGNISTSQNSTTLGNTGVGMAGAGANTHPSVRTQPSHGSANPATQGAGADAENQTPKTSSITLQTQVTGASVQPGTSLQTRPTQGIGASVQSQQPGAQTQLTMQPTKGAEAAAHSQQPQASEANPRARSSQGAGTGTQQSPTPQGTGGARAGDSQVSCPCEE